MYRHKKVYELRYTDVDVFDNLKPSSLLSFLEESACLSADELGFGYDDITPKNLGFIIVNWYIELTRAIKLGEKLEVHTWPIKPKHTIFLRDFELFVGGEQVGRCTARWCMINLKDFSICPVSAFFGEGAFDDYNTERSVEFTRWKIPAVTCDEPKYEKLATYSDCDHYRHVNNTKYADILLDFLGESAFDGKFISSLQLTYGKQCKEGELLKVYAEEIDDGYIVEGRVGGETRVQLRVGFDKI